MVSAFTEMQFIDPPFSSSPCTAQEFLLSHPPGITTGTQIWALREDLDASPPIPPLLLSHFGRALTGKERGIFIAHTALCILSLAFVFPRYTCVYPQPFLQAEMLIWHPTWKV